MLSKVKAVRFAQEIRTGRNSPLLIGCEQSNGSEIELVVKTTTKECPAGGLAREAWSAILAADLGLPVPEPFIVELSADFASSLTEENSSVRDRLQTCENLAFGSAYVSPGFMNVVPGQSIPKDLRDEAAEIYCFDALILNADRRPQNPNCLSDGNTFVIFDHELALNLTGVGGPLLPYPWEVGSLNGITSGPSEHLFAKELKGKSFSFGRLEDAWKNLKKPRYAEYHRALPRNWATIDGISDSIKDYLVLLHENLSSAFGEVRRSLK